MVAHTCLFYFLKLYVTIKEYFKEYVTKPYEDYTRKTMANRILRIKVFYLNEMYQNTLFSIPPCYHHIYNLIRFLTGKCSKPIDYHFIRVHNYTVYPENKENTVYEISYYTHSHFTRDLHSFLIKRSMAQQLYNNTCNVSQTNRHRPHNVVLYAGIHNVCNITDFINKYASSFNKENNFTADDVIMLAYLKRAINFHQFYEIANAKPADKMQLSITMNEDLQEYIFKSYNHFVL